jgi:uncharacterized protein with PIN domain
VRLLCDAMLADVARWLRAAGYDTTLAAPGEPDAALVERCAAEGRLLLTRDRRLVEDAATVERLLVPKGELVDVAQALADRLGICWTHAPFTRCLVDNAPLRLVTVGEQERVPDHARTASGAVHACPACGRLYWPGGHVRRMLDRLTAFGRQS